MSVDPYAPPSAPVQDEATGNFDIADGKLHASSPLVLPSHICVKCGANEASTETYDKKLAYTPPWVIFGFLVIGVLIIPVWLIVQKKLEIVYGLCQGCVARRKKRMVIAIVSCVGSLAALVVGIAFEVVALILLGFLGFLAAIIAIAIFANPPIKAAKHSDGIFTLKGPSDETLKRLDEHQSPELASW